MEKKITDWLNPDEMQALVKSEFDLFFKASPFAYSGDTTKTAMNGAYYAGFNLAQERIIKKITDLLPPTNQVK